MKLFATRTDAAAPPLAERPAHDIQTRPVRFAQADGAPPGQLKVDAAYQIGNRTLVAGWRTGAAEIDLFCADHGLKAQAFAVPRHDVATHLGLSGAQADTLGFVLVAEHSRTDGISIGWRLPGRSAFEVAPPLTVRQASAFCSDDQGAVGPALGLFAAAATPFSPAWCDAVARVPAATSGCRQVAAYLEGAYACRQTGHAVVTGWVAHAPDLPVWLEDGQGNLHRLDGAYRLPRQDVSEALGPDFGSCADTRTGFQLRLDGVLPGERLVLKALSPAGVHTISETVAANLPAEPVAAARSLFSLAVPMDAFHERIALLDEPVLKPIMERVQSCWSELPVRVHALGQAPRQPLVSIIVPLYGRADFVEHQLLEMSRDPWIREHAELIYVIDDPKLPGGFGTLAESLHRLYRLPFTWVWGSANRGFSGANNLGAAHARGEHLLFLNSDAFPQSAGWLGELVEVLRTRPDIGAVGPRLTFADGGIQHAGMTFLRRQELGIWVNHHPHMGLDPALDPHRELTIVPAVTGACLAMRRQDFDAVGGWDTGYLIGDFEDSDLCLKLRSRGLHIAYLPKVQLTHLERQSFRLLGQDEFRTRVVVYNAVRHQRRWSALLETEAVSAD